MQAGRSAFFVSVQKRFCFSAFKRQRSWIACLLPQGCPEGLGWTGKNHPRYAPVFFPARPCAKRQSKRPEAYKIGKTHPDGIIHFKRKTMKVARIEKTGKQAVTLFLITGICLLANKGIVPIGLIALLLLTGGLMDLLFSLLFLVVKFMAVLAVLGLLFH